MDSKKSGSSKKLIRAYAYRWKIGYGMVSLYFMNNIPMVENICYGLWLKKTGIKLDRRKEIEIEIREVK